jgi:hypothetical protein
VQEYRGTCFVKFLYKGSTVLQELYRGTGIQGLYRCAGVVD